MKHVSEDARKIAQDLWDTFWGDFQSERWSVDDIASVIAKYLPAASPTQDGLTVEEARCVWTATMRVREWATGCGVTTEVFNSCHKFCGFCGRSIQWGDTEMTQAILAGPHTEDSAAGAYEDAAQIAENCTQDDAARDEPFRIAATIREHARRTLRKRQRASKESQPE